MQWTVHYIFDDDDEENEFKNDIYPSSLGLSTNQWTWAAIVSESIMLTPFNSYVTRIEHRLKVYNEAFDLKWFKTPSNYLSLILVIKQTETSLQLFLFNA